ncbi:MAG TPA: cell division protein ZapA [Aquabacterium sp.]|jgi:cell division protein ZapA|uniref:cell division protein ZapA n=1 Tax=Aquabacterium sp. TaxID=1872578 RepID=UPI002E2F8F29|nr:cell division protein ZapA [Aquabacterium sp.]HEX5373519.1 cell division protein ZapA [Aquabacterium sp.]
MKQIEVSIMGQSYLLGCPEGGEQQLRHAVSHVDREMCAIRDSGKLKARERIAVLAALNLAFELAAVPEQARVASGAQADHEQGSHKLSPEYMNSLIQRVDAALNQDGHLL